MSDTELYLRELRRALPVGCRRRVVAEVRDHFASAAEAGEDERLTIERLGPAQALADQLLADVRSGALGPLRRSSAALTPPRLAAAAALVALAITGGVLLAATRSSPAPPKPLRTARTQFASPAVTLDPRTGEVAMVMYAVERGLQRYRGPTTVTLRLHPTGYFIAPATPRN